MRNFFEAAVRNQSTRLVASNQCDRESLTTLLPEDLPSNFGTTWRANRNQNIPSKNLIQAGLKFAVVNSGHLKTVQPNTRFG